jgi:hypothetical protein
MWMRLNRTGDQITGSLSTDGTTWNELGSYTLALPREVLIGLAVTSHDTAQIATAGFSRLRLERRPSAPPVESDPTPEPTPNPDPDPDPADRLGRFEPPPATLFVATDGSDANSGRTVDAPLRTIARAASLVEAGDVVYLRGGVYPLQVKFRQSGTRDRPIVWTSYPGEWAILDGSDQTPGVSTQRVWVEGASWNVFAGFEVRNGPRQGIFIVNGHDNVFHGIITHGHHGSGIQNYSGDRNRFEYVVAYDNFDVEHPEGKSGEDADGIGISSGYGNVLYRVVTFNNSDDGIDTWKSTHTLIDGAVSFANGRGSHGNGNGIKAGGGIDNYTTVQNSIAFHNRSTGITHNSGRHMWFYNNTSFDNGGAAFVANTTVVLRNNVAIGSRLSLGGAESRHNTWDLGITDVRFVSTEPSDEGFLALSADSPAIEAGVDVGLDFSGDAPDLGAIPYNMTLADVIDPAMVEVGYLAALLMTTTGAISGR